MTWIERAPSSEEEYLLDETGDIIMAENGEGILLYPAQDKSTWVLNQRE